MRVLIRTSKWAIWARRFGSFALPLTIVPVLLHREQLIESRDFVTVGAVAAGFAVLAVLLGLGAFARLWVTGDRGWVKATWGIVFGLICLAPVGYLGYEALHYPRINEVATDFGDPVEPSVPVRVLPTSAALQAEIAERFPNARTREYPVDPSQMVQIVSDLADAAGWDVRTTRQPDGTAGDWTLTAVATTLFGWRDTVAVRVRTSSTGSVVDMRSIPLSDFHDFGENGRRIEDFLLGIDEKVRLLMRNAPQTPAAPADDAAAPSGG